MSTPGQRGSIDIESEMLPQDPPPWIVRWSVWLLLGFLLFAFILSIVMKLPETVQCRLRSCPPRRGSFSRHAAAVITRWA